MNEDVGEGCGCLLMLIGVSVVLMTLFAMTQTDRFIQIVEAIL